MTVTRKVSSLLLLLTAGSLLGILTFGVFYAGSSSDGLFWIACNFEGGFLDQFRVQALMIREGQDSARITEQQLVENFDDLLTALEFGGRASRAGTSEGSIEVMSQIGPLMADRELSPGEFSKHLLLMLNDELPVPPADVSVSAHAIREAWNGVREPLLTISRLPANDPGVPAAYELFESRAAGMGVASHRLELMVGERLLSRRQTMVRVLTGIAVSAFALLVIGLIAARRYIANPISRLRQSIGRIRGGEQDHRAAVTSNDEIAELARHFNEMLDELQRSAERYRVLFDNATDFVYVTDLKGNFQAVNQAGERMLGYDHGELIGTCIDDLAVLPDKITGEHPTAIFEVEVRTKDGRKLILENSSSPIIENGRVVGIQGTSRDITERKRLQEQLRTSQKMEAIGRFAGGVAHDFGNVLTIINGYCALIRNRMSSGDPLRNEIEGIQKAGERAASMIRHLLGFSKGQIFRPKVLKPGPALMDMSVVLQRLVGEDVNVIVDAAPDLGRVRFDPAQLEQVIINLSLNARDSMKSGGTLEIRARDIDILTSQGLKNEVPAGPYVRLTVKDSGSGMAPEVLDQIFEPFFSTKEQGTGLGLSTVQGIIRQCGGYILAESALDVGTTITIYLPRVEESMEEPVEQSEVSMPPKRPGTETIMVVEDEEDVRHLVRDMLRLGGYRVLEAASGPHAFEICDRPQSRIDLLLTDVVMPNMSGPQVVEKVRGSRPGLKVIYMSGYPQDKFENAGFATTSIHFLQKPLLQSSLLNAVRRVLDGSDPG